MPFDGNGTYTPPSPDYPAVSGQIIYASRWNGVVEDIADALSNVITRDGQSPALANLPMNGFRLTGMGAGAAASDALRYDQVLSSANTLLANMGTAGSFAVGSAVVSNALFYLGGSITGSTSAFGARNTATIQSGVTNTGIGYSSAISTAAAAFTLGTLHHFRVDQGTIGAGSTVTSQAGFAVGASLTGAANNYGFYGDIPTGTNRWNLYMSGTAQNYMAGKLGVGIAVPTESLDVVGSIKVSNTMYATDGTNTVMISGPDGGIELVRTDGAYIDFKTSGAEDHDIRLRNTAADTLTISSGAGALATLLRIDGRGEFETAGSTGTMRLIDTGVNGANLRLDGNGAVTPSKYIRVNAGIFEILNNGYSVALFAMTDAGAITLAQDLPVTEGGTGASTAAGARTNLGFTSAVVDRAYAEYTANAVLSSIIPGDDTIPQSGEGSQILTLNITPKSATNRLRVSFNGQVVANGTTPLVVAIFAGGANAIDAKVFTPPGAAVAFGCSTEVEFVPGVTTAVTISVRVGPTAAANIYFNGGTGGRLLGGASRATLIVEEITA
jgi:hypothetical protein